MSFLFRESGCVSSTFKIPPVAAAAVVSTTEHLQFTKPRAHILGLKLARSQQARFTQSDKQRRAHFGGKRLYRKSEVGVQNRPALSLLCPT